MLNQQRGLPRRNQMPMRTGGNFGGGFALNPALRNLSTVMQPRFKGQGVTEADPDIIAALEVPGGGTFIGAGGRKTTVEPGYIAPPSSVKNVSQNITPQMKKQIDQELNIALNREQTGQQITNFNGENGERTFTPDDQQSTIDNAALQERLKGRYDAPGYTKGQKIAAIAGVLGDVFSAPGDRNKTATIMQTIEAQRAGDMQRQQARLADESHRSVVGSLIKSGVISEELAPAAMANPELLSTILELRAKDTSIGGSTDIDAKRVGIEKTREDIKSSIAKTVLEEEKFDRSNFDSTRDYEFAVLKETNRRSESRERLDNDRFKIDESVRQYGIDSALERAKFEAQESAKRAAALREAGKPKKYSKDAKDSAMFANKADNAIQALSRIEMNTDYNAGLSGADKFTGKEIAQSYEQAKKEFITAVLRRESGAAIGKDEYKQYGQIYFPAANDSPLVIEQKRKSRELQLASMINQSDGFYSDPNFAVDPYDASVVDRIIANYNGVEYTDPVDQSFILKNSIQ
jgi:hypothetical protein